LSAILKFLKISDRPLWFALNNPNTLWFFNLTFLRLMEILNATICVSVQFWHYTKQEIKVVSSIVNSSVGNGKFDFIQIPSLIEFRSSLISFDKQLFDFMPGVHFIKHLFNTFSSHLNNCLMTDATVQQVNDIWVYSSKKKNFKSSVVVILS